MKNNLSVEEMLHLGNAPQELIDEVNLYIRVANSNISRTRENEHTIMFIPVCSECGSPVFEEVNVSEDHPFGLYTVSPGGCSKCGTYFNSVIMPARLPFKWYGGIKE